MAKPTHKSDAADPLITGHPLLNQQHAATDLLKRLQSRDKVDEFKVDQLDEWRAAINRLAASDDGRMLLRAMLQFSNYNVHGDISNTVKMVEDNGKQSFYKRWVRPYLDRSLRFEVEP